LKVVVENTMKKFHPEREKKKRGKRRRRTRRSTRKVGKEGGGLEKKENKMGVAGLAMPEDRGRKAKN